MTFIDDSASNHESVLMLPITVKFKKIDPRAQIPKFQSAGAAGFDFHSLKEVTLRVGEVSMVSTGLCVEIPEGYELQIRARSGLSAKLGVFLVNGVGTIDSDYRGEIKILLSTCSIDPVALAAGERIAQGVVSKIERPLIEEARELSDTIRGSGGFGSTGITSTI